MNVKNKNILNQIAKRFAKSLLLTSEASIHFEDSGLEESEIEYLENCLFRIANRITEQPTAVDTGHLVSEYFEFD